MNAYNVICIAISFATLVGIGTVFKLFWEDRHQKKIDSTSAAKAAARSERQEEVREVVIEVVEPVKEDVIKLKENSNINNTGTCAVLKDRLYQLFRYCAIQKGYTEAQDRENFENMYKSYHALGGNGVMTEIHDKFMHIPTEEEYVMKQNQIKATKRKSKKESN